MDINKPAGAKGVPAVSEKWDKFQVVIDYADSGGENATNKGRLDAYETVVGSEEERNGPYGSGWGELRVR